jgi:hypothetical protein
MDNRSFESASSASPPTAPGSPSVGYPTNGNPGTGTPATKPGAYWFHQLGEEIRNVITAAGLTPASGTLTQLLTSLNNGWGMSKIIAASGYITLPGGLIIQWGSATITTTRALYNLPVTFPNNFLFGIVSDFTINDTVVLCGVASASTTSQIQLVGQTGIGTVNYLAIGN